jgi:pyruvate-ferredoxin/flavodoxin oxidoreductase
VIVIMGSGAETVQETVEHLQARGEKVGVVKVRLYRPFSRAALLAALPASTRSLAVLDRSKEPGAPGDPLYLDVMTALGEARADGRAPFEAEPRVIAGRYGLSSKEFTPGMVKAIFDELGRETPRRHFTVGIVDDVTHLSLPWDPSFRTEGKDVSTSLFYGLGADGTVGANKNSIKIIGQETDRHVQGYFVYDSKKSGAITVSHLRSSPNPIRSAYLVDRASFVACHQFEFVDKIDVLEYAAPGAVFLLNAPQAADAVWDHLPRELQEQIVEKKIRFFTIDAYALAKKVGMGGRINTIMQTCFFGISGILPRDEAIAHIKKSIEKSYGKRGPEVVRRNCEVVDQALAHLHEVAVPGAPSATRTRPPLVSEKAPDFVQKITAVMLAGKGDLLPVSAFPVDGTWPTGTAKWEKRNLALEIPVWDPRICIQCNQCALVCPARRHPGQGLRRRGAGRAAFHLQGHELPRERIQGKAVHDPGRARGLHRLQPLHQRLPGQGPHQPQAQGHQHGAPGAAPRDGAGQLRLLPRPARAARVRKWRASTTRARSSWSRSSSTPAPARAVARRRTSRC